MSGERATLSKKREGRSLTRSGSVKIRSREATGRLVEEEKGCDCKRQASRNEGRLWWLLGR